MARSARRRRERSRTPGAAQLVTALAAGLALAGCTTTQHEAQRLQLDAARQRAALRPTRVVAANPAVAPISVATVAAGGRTAFVVTVRNRGHRAVTDLPISVGYERPDGTRVYLNAASGLGYFQAHLPAIRAQRSLTWVYTAGRSLPRGTRPFAVVGSRPSAPARLTEMDVQIGAGYGRTSMADAVTVHLDNPTSVPQYELQIYAYAREHGRYVTAGDATVGELGAGARRRVRLTLTGPAPADLHVQAVPTILQ